jgi:hypothetical protein
MRWRVYYYRQQVDAILVSRRGVETVKEYVGEVDADDATDARRLARTTYGTMKELGYRLHVEPIDERESTGETAEPEPVRVHPTRVSLLNPWRPL